MSLTHWWSSQPNTTVGLCSPSWMLFVFWHASNNKVSIHVFILWLFFNCATSERKFFHHITFVFILTGYVRDSFYQLGVDQVDDWWLVWMTEEEGQRWEDEWRRGPGRRESPPGGWWHSSEPNWWGKRTAPQLTHHNICWDPAVLKDVTSFSETFCCIVIV